MDGSIEFGSSCLAGFFSEAQVPFMRSMAFPEKKKNLVFFSFFFVASSSLLCVCVEGEVAC